MNASPFTIIEPGALIGRNTRILSHCYLYSGIEIGDDCFVGHHTIIRPFSKIYNKKKFLSDYSNRKMYSYILAENKNKNLNLYDYDSFSKAYLMSLAWNNIHTLLDSNSKYYFNPYTLKLEPITMDQGYWSKITETENNLNHLDMLTGNFVYMNLFSDEKYIAKGEGAC